MKCPSCGAAKMVHQHCAVSSTGAAFRAFLCGKPRQCWGIGIQAGAVNGFAKQLPRADGRARSRSFC